MCWLCEILSLAGSERSFQAKKMKNKDLMVVSRLSQEIDCLQDDLSSEFKHLCREMEVKAALEVMDKVENKGIFFGLA